ncbi:hypothetical protein HAHE_39020 [Haloferula helveola]|uniref:SCP domain-containing protein n=1 Tax=Haloferula helveola TaxID=490095 RepID=A0ABM7RHS6_9BACT|nr:hypothetical protein HAHE_39020 [Haloferula helveola]
MKTTSLLPWVGLGGMLLLASCSSSLDTTRVPMSATASHSTPSKSISQSAVVRKLDASINAYRRSIGREPLQRHSGLDRMAQEHCEFMARNRGKFSVGSQNISHYGFEQRTMVAQRTYGMGSVAENVAGGVIQGDIASQLTSAWTGSKGHRFNLKQKWHTSGLGVYVAADGMVYATQIFATKGLSAPTKMAFREHLGGF